MRVVRLISQLLDVPSLDPDEQWRSRLLNVLLLGVAGITLLALLPLLLLLGRSHSDPHGPLGVRMGGIVGGTLTFIASLLFLRYPLRPRRGGMSIALALDTDIIVL